MGAEVSRLKVLFLEVDGLPRPRFVVIQIQIRICINSHVLIELDAV